VEPCLRAHSPGSGPAARLDAVAFIHRFGSTLNAHLYFHRVVIDRVFDAAAASAIIFHTATALDPHAIAAVATQVRPRLLRLFVRRGLLPDDDARAMGSGNTEAALPSIHRPSHRLPCRGAHLPPPILWRVDANGRSRKISTTTPTGSSWPGQRRSSLTASNLTADGRSSTRCSRSILRKADRRRG
jgi:hypothetical protein